MLSIVDDGRIALVIGKEQTQPIMKQAIKKHQWCTYVSPEHIDDCQKKVSGFDVDYGKIFFIAHAEEKKYDDDFITLKKPVESKEIINALQHAQKRGLQNFVIIDSLEKIAHHEPKKVVPIVHEILVLLREYELPAVILAEKENNNTELIAHLCDVVIHQD